MMMTKMIMVMMIAPKKMMMVTRVSLSTTGFYVTTDIDFDFQTNSGSRLQ